MSQSEIARFVTDLVSNASLRAEAEKAQFGRFSASLDNVRAFATDKGYDFSAGELVEFTVAAQAKAKSRGVADAELDGVVGGTSTANGADEVSAAVAAVFSGHAQAYQALSDQAATLHNQFLGALSGQPSNKGS